MIRPSKLHFASLILAIALLLAPLSMLRAAQILSNSRELAVAVAQPMVTPGAVEKNLRNMEALITEAARRGAQLLVFSECALTGYDLKGVGARAALALDAPQVQSVADLARSNAVVIVAGFYEKLGDKLHNTAVVFFPNGRRVVQRKHLILAPERAACPVVAAERQRTFFEVDGFRGAVLICSDAGTPGIWEELAREKCDIAIVITAGAGDESFGLHQSALADPARRKSFAEKTATCLSPESIEQCVRLNFAQVACNQFGWEAGTGYFQPGGSSIVDRTGRIAAVIPTQLVFEQLRPELAVGRITRPTLKP